MDELVLALHEILPQGPLLDEICRLLKICK